MDTVTLVHHKVADYDAWRQVYEGVREVQKAGGVKYERVFRAADDPSLVVVVHHFSDRASAEAFFAQDELKGAMEQAGVDLSSLRIEYLDDQGGGEL
jgi:quinol monooxygenase YgiN